jgi:UDP-glucose 4-epimerase
VGAGDAAAASQALTVPLEGHHRVLLCAASIAATAPSLELATRLAPHMPVTGPDRYRANPRAALIDCSAAAATFGWRATRQWSRGRRRPSRNTPCGMSTAFPPPAVVYKYAG